MQNDGPFDSVDPGVAFCEAANCNVPSTDGCAALVCYVLCSICIITLILDQAIYMHVPILRMQNDGPMEPGTPACEAVNVPLVDACTSPVRYINAHIICIPTYSLACQNCITLHNPGASSTHAPFA